MAPEQDPVLEELKRKRRFPNAFYNPITLAGLGIALLSISLIVFLVALDVFSSTSKPYVGVLAFIIMPILFIFGGVLVFYGAWRYHRILLHTGAVIYRLPRLDLNDPRHLRAVLIGGFGIFLVISMAAFTSYQAYEYTESDEFCGATCHEVMSPEYTAYQFSPHARVGCVECHIGSGADYFVKSKLSGSYQVYAVAFNKFPRPIPTPIQNLRPAQETCEQCHWPKNFFSEKMHKNTYFLSDEKNTQWDLDLLMKIGGGNIEVGPTSGIHWHMNIAHQVTYGTLDSSRQVIAWARSRDSSGAERVYWNLDQPLTAEDSSKIVERRMDCLDCHNRPSHAYHPPAASVNTSMAYGWIDPSLPYIKSVSVDALERPYSTKPAALDSIRHLLTSYYNESYPDVARTKSGQIEQTISELQKIYSRNYFPEMRVSWKKYPDNIGHLYYPGCFRCHNGKHATTEGKVLSRDCNACHTILAQQFKDDKLRMSLGGVEYRHPVDIGDAWKEMNCSDCHNSR